MLYAMMDTHMLLSLRFRAHRSDPSLVEVAEVIGDLEALYHASQHASEDKRRLLPIFLAQRQAQRGQAPGLSDDALAEIERGSRALRLLERVDSDPETIDLLRGSLQLLARQQTEAIYYGRALGASESAGGVPLHVRRLTMASPLDLITSIPPEYWTGGGLALFLTAVERKFNFVTRIRTERLELAARQATARAVTTEAELQDVRAQRALSQLRERESTYDEERLEGIEEPRASFELEEGELSPEDPEHLGSPLKD
jgi:hypothetical protein